LQVDVDSTIALPRCLVGPGRVELPAGRRRDLRIARDHRGRIEVKRVLGKGTEFVAYLPLHGTS
jgi:hypothetical protein